jgi:3-deoxy-D-manno-octulosonate 8-phosphate phosphatase (KDO 8-P phosphatase)
MFHKEAIQEIKLIAFDFDGVFTDNKVIVSEDGVEHVLCNRSDGLGLAKINELGIATYIISTETNKVVASRAKKLNIRCKYGVSDKSLAIKEICEELQIDLKNVMFVGNDINDIAAFNIVGTSVAVKDAFDEVLPYVDFQTEREGGNGAVREICDHIFNILKKN